jgi:S1-C subfamily serine protease
MGRSALVGGFVGAVVAALVTTSAFMITDDDSSGPDRTGPTAPIATAARTDQAPVAIADTDLRGLLTAIRPAVVRVSVDTFVGEGEGTGFIVSSDGVIVTNAHVAGDANGISVTLSDGDVESAELLGADSAHDLAVIKIARRDLPTIELGDSDPPVTQVGDGVIAIGNALGLEGQLSVTTGIVSALDRQVPVGNTTLVSVIQTDAAINPGNSGGPLVNTRGEVIGINTAIAPPQESNNVGFAISISSAKPIIEALRDGREPEVAFLGVESRSVTPQIADEDDLVTTIGAQIIDVVPGSPADDFGFEEGDVIVALDGEAIDTDASLLRSIRRHRAGETVDVRIERDGSARTIRVELGTLPADNI